MDYKASLDTKAKIITVLTFVLLTYLGYKSIVAIQQSQDIAIISTHSIILLLYISILLVSYLFAPKSYRIDSTSLIIVRSISDKKVMLSDIEEIRSIEDGEAGGAIRTFGVGGLFGYYGRFNYDKAGSITQYATQSINMIFLKTKQGKQIIITPDDKNRLLKELKLKLAN